MDNIIVKNTLEAQLQLLHERSKQANDDDLVSITDQMVFLSRFLETGIQSSCEASTNHLCAERPRARGSAEMCAEEDELFHRQGPFLKR